MKKPAQKKPARRASGTALQFPADPAGILESLPEGVLVTDAGWKIRYVNGVLLRAAVCSAKDLIGLHLCQLDEKTGWANRSIHAFAPCSVHDNKNQYCLIYYQRPEICRTFPAHPGQIEKTPCSYWFQWI